jgi:pyridoxamine 5'-phosphate oxidase family protein
VEPIESETRNGTNRIKPPVAFNDAETEYLSENVLGRLATVSRDKQPHVVPVAYRFDGSSFFFSGFNLVQSLKYRNIMGNNLVAFVVDDLESTRPWRPRGIEVRGYAEPIQSGGHLAVRIVPMEKKTWGIRG